MAYAQGPRAPAVCRRSTGGQPSQPRSCSPRPALCGGATEKDGPPDCRRLTHPQLRYPLGRAWDPLSHPLSHHLRPEQSRVLSTYGTHFPPTSGTPTPGHSVASNRKFSFPRTIVISNGYLFFSGRNFGLVLSQDDFFCSHRKPKKPSNLGFVAKIACDKMNLTMH